MLNSLLSSLKPRQLEAIKHTQAPQLILAGAGTGKTTTITAKIAYMVEKENIDPSQILALTFSKEAARNMREKVEKLIQGKEVIVKTFHSFCAELIKDHAERCKIPGDFKIFEEMDSAIFIFRELGTDARTASLYANTIGKAKDLNISIDKFKEFLETLKKQVQDIEKDESKWKELYRESKFKLNTFRLQEFKDKEDKKAKQAEKKRYSEFIDLYEEYQKYSNFISAWEKYEEKKSAIGALDYGDLNKIALWYLDVYGTQELNDTFRYIIIDEFQDTNYVQFELIRKLTAANKNITVVADPNQTIYAFRGAYTNNIEEFKEQFNPVIVSLDVSFRSTNKILRVAHTLIEKNYGDDKKKECLLIKNHKDTEGENVNIIETEDDNEEARAIIEKIEGYLAQGIPPKEIAVLYRTHAQGRKVRHALENRGLPFRVKDDTDFLKQPEIKAIKYAEDEREPSEFLQDIGYDNWRVGGNITVGDISYFRDTDTKVREMVKDSALEREKAVRKRLLIESLDSGDFNESMKNMLLYQALKAGETSDFKEVFNSNWKKINPALDAENILGKIKDNKNGLKFNPASMTFSYSSISSYEQCPRQYELAELLRMPTRDSEDSTGAMRRGNFVHKVLEKAVSEKITSKHRLYEIRDTVAKEPEFKGVDIEAATGALDVFWERNKDTIANNLMVEQRFTVPLGGFNFKGFIDRVDLIPGTKNEIEIIDYKAGKYEPGPIERSRQLLLYALGIEHVYPKYKVKRLTLELLARPNPRTFEMTCGKYECAGSSRMEGLDEDSIDDMIEIAKSIAHDYEHGFERTKDEKACGECGYGLYCGE